MSRTLNEDDVLKEIDRWIGYLDEDMITRIKISIRKISSAQPEKRYTKADYIMALHKEYGCPLEAAEKAHDAALEYLRSLSRLKG